MLQDKKSKQKEVSGITRITSKRTLLKPTFLYEEMRRRLVELKRTEAERSASLAKSPEGEMHVVASAKRTQFYLRSTKKEKSGKYISKKDEATIRVYLQKAYDRCVVKLLKKEIKNLENHLKASENIYEKIRQAYSLKSQDIKKYLNPVDMSDEDYKRQWAGIPFRAKEITENVPFYETKRGERVRSKSEINIANALNEHGIAYKYECPLTLKNGVVIHPDFTILDPKNRSEIYWEHRGMMDEEDYARNSVARIKMMQKNGIVIGKNLIISEETAQCPLGTDEIEYLIEEFLQKQVMTETAVCGRITV